MPAHSNPFFPRLATEERLFHATFLFEHVAEQAFGRLKLPVQPGEEAALVGEAVLLYCPHGYGRTKLTNAYFEKALSVSATTRNWRTVLALRDMCAEE